MRINSLTKYLENGIEKAGQLGKDAVKTGMQGLLHIREYAAGGLKDLSKGMEKVKKETISVQMEKKYGEVRVSAPGYKFQFPTAGAARVLEEGSPTIIINGRKEESVSDNVSGDTVEIHAIVGTSKDQLKFEEQKENAEYIYDYLFDKGWTPEAICGLLGNINEESHFNPAVWQVYNNEKFGYGLVQFTGKEFIQWSEKDSYVNINELAQNSPKELMDLQLEYIIYSSQADKDGKRWYDTSKYDSPYKMTYEQYIKSRLSVEELALVFHASYERSGDDAEGRKERAESAKDWYDILNNNQSIEKEVIQ